MKKIFSIAFVLFVILSVALPVVTVFAQQDPDKGVFGGVCDGPECDFSHFLLLGTNIIEFLILVSIPLAAIAFTWSGILLLTSGGSESKKDEAKGIFTKVLIGFLFVLGAWLIVKLITTALVVNDEFDDTYLRSSEKTRVIWYN